MRERILVTTKENVTFNDDNTFELQEPTLVGHLVQLHTMAAHQVNPETGALESGIMVKGEVYWEHDRNLSTATLLIPVDDLVWLKFADDDLEVDETEEEEEEDNEDEWDDESNHEVGIA